MFDYLQAAVSGPGALRFIVQPLIALILGVRDGRSDARAGAAPYGYALLSGVFRRRDLLAAGVRQILVPLCVGFSMDVVVRLALGFGFHPVASAVVGCLLVGLPYIAARGLANRLSTRLILIILLLSPGQPLRAQGEILPMPRQATMGSLEYIIEDAVRDPRRRRELIVLGKDIDGRQVDVEKSVDEFARRLAWLNADYNATRDQFDDLDDKYSGSIDTQRRRLAKKIVEMQSMARPDEWQRIGEALASGSRGGFALAPGFNRRWFGQGVRDRLPRYIADKARLRRAQQFFEIIEKTLDGYDRMQGETASHVTVLVQRQGSRWEDFEPLFSALANDWTGSLSKCVETRFMMRDVISKEEWKLIFTTENL